MLRQGSIRKANIEMGGAPGMAATMEHTRLGLLHLFSHIEFGSKSGLVGKSVLNVSAASIYFASEMGSKMLVKNAATLGPSLTAVRPSFTPENLATASKITGTISKELIDFAAKVGTKDYDLAYLSMPVADKWWQRRKAEWKRFEPQIPHLIEKAVESGVYFIVPYMKSAVHLVESINAIIKAVINE